MSWLAQASKEKPDALGAPECPGPGLFKFLQWERYTQILHLGYDLLELTGTISPNDQIWKWHKEIRKQQDFANCAIVPPAHLWWGSQTPLCPGLGFLVVQVVLVLCLMSFRVSGRTSDQTSSAFKAPSASALTKQIWVAQSASGKTSYMFKLLFFILSQISSQNEPKLSNFALDCGACNGTPWRRPYRKFWETDMCV